MSSAIGVIQGFHAVAAMTSGQPHWLVNDQDAQRYGQALANAARHFPLKATQKAIDVSALIICAVAIEAPRITMSMQLSRQPLRPPRPFGPAQVFQFRTPASQPASTQTSAAPPPQAAAGEAGELAEGPIDLGENLGPS